MSATKTHRATSKRTVRGGKPKARNRQAKYVRFLIVALLVVGNIFLWIGTSGHTKAAPSGYFWHYEEQQFMSILNTHRISIGRQPLTTSQCMSQAARAWSQQMATTNILGHSSSDRLTNYCGVSPASGENAQYLWVSATAQDSFDSWQGSPGHKANMEDPYYTHTGVGYYWDKVHGKMWGTQIFIDCERGHVCPASITDSPALYPTTPADAICHSLTVPDSVKAGQSFSATINWENTGNAPWFSTYKLVATNSHWGLSQTTFFGTTTTAGYHINPGITGSLKGTFTAPSSPGSYEFFWQPRNASGAAFGATCGKVISVAGGAAAKAPSPKATTPEAASPTTPETSTPPEEPASQEAAKKQNTTATQAQKATPTNDTENEKSWPTQLTSYVTSMPTTVKAGISIAVFLIVSSIIIYELQLHKVSLMNLIHKLKSK